MFTLIKSICFRFLLILFGFLYFSVAMAQDKATDTNEKKSYFKASGNYLSNSVYYGRTDSLITPYLTPSIGYYNKSGFYVTGSLSYLASAAESRIDLYSFDAGYDFDLVKNLSGSVYGNKSFFNQSSTAIKSDVKGSLGAYLSYDFDFLQVIGGTDIMFSNKTDIGLNLGLTHTFTFGEENKLFTIIPSIVANMSTLHFYEGYTSRKIGKKIRKATQNLVSSNSVTTVDNNKLTLLDYECSLPLTYDFKKIGFFITPTLSIPQNPIYTTTTTVNKFKNGTQNTQTKNSTPGSEMHLKNNFFTEFGFYFKF